MEAKPGDASADVQSIGMLAGRRVLEAGRSSRTDAIELWRRSDRVCSWRVLDGAAD